MKCEYHPCKLQASTEVLFTSGSKARYCSNHAATFDKETIEESTPINTSPLIEPTRMPCTVSIEEKNDGATSLNTSFLYASQDLPEWFKPLQAIIEDRTVNNIVINLGHGVHYHIKKES